MAHPPRNSRQPRAAADEIAMHASTQLDLFPVTPVVEVLDPREVVGVRTGVEHLVRVRPRPSDAPHLVFHDRHGWYCEQHGPQCATVRLARDAVPA